MDMVIPLAKYLDFPFLPKAIDYSMVVKAQANVIVESLNSITSQDSTITKTKPDLANLETDQEQDIAKAKLDYY